MSEILDLDRLLQPVSQEQPCGAGLEDFVFSSEFGELQRTAQGRDEQVMGDEVIPAEEPDWRAVREQALTLFDQVKSLRVAVHLAKSLTVREGLAGLVSGLALIRGLLDRYWNQVEPILDDGDATERLYTLAELNSVEGFLRLVRKAPLVSSQVIGQFSIRDCLVARDRLVIPKGEEGPQLAAINQALMDVDVAQLQERVEQLDQVIEHARAIERLFSDQVGDGSQLSLDELRRLGTDLRPLLVEALQRRGIVSSEGAAGDEPQAAGADAQPAPAAASGDIRSREDVIAALDRISEYFNRHEPSSPIPLLMQRAKRLVSQDFMAILKDLAPDGMKQIEMISGIKKDK